VQFQASPILNHNQREGVTLNLTTLRVLFDLLAYLCLRKLLPAEGGHFAGTMVWWGSRCAHV